MCCDVTMPNARRRDDVPEGVLFIGGDSMEATSILEALAVDGQPRIERARSLADGLTRLLEPGVTSILLMLTLPDSCGINTFDRIAMAAGQIPILVLCGVDDESSGRLAVARGADDFVLADHFDRYSLTRAVATLGKQAAGDHARCDDTELARVTLNSIGDAVVCTDTAGYVTYLNTVAEAMTGWWRADAEGRALQDVVNIINGATGERSPNPAELAVRQNRTVTLTENCILVRRDGSQCAIEDSAAPIHDRAGRIAGAVIVFHDVSTARRVSLQLSHLAQHDSLTDLPNRMLVRDRLQQAVSLARRHACRAAVLFVDLDRFKHVNDSLGHDVGDQLLKEVAARLTSSMRESDTVGRQSGDEFVVVLSDLENAASASAAGTKVLARLTAPYRIGVHNLCVSASIGISVYPDDAADAETLLQHADTAMYHAKANGRNDVKCFAPEMVGRAAERQFVETRRPATSGRRQIA
jgi:diguanylate cyclase (GGDEF)-like protein/PAS domain S-box-containing protein